MTMRTASLLLVAMFMSQTGDAITIRPARSNDATTVRMRVLPDGDFVATGVSVLALIGYAYDVPVNPSPRLSGPLENRTRYDIDVKASDKRVGAQELIRQLLTDRFKLDMRVEEKTVPVYALTVAAGGITFQKSATAEKDCVFDTGTPSGCHSFRIGRGHPLDGDAITMDDLARYIENWSDLPVVNRTALTGLFDVQTDGWRPMTLPPPPPGGNPPGFAGYDDLPTIFAVLRPLGLELKPQQATVPFYTVAHIEKPSA